MPQLPQDRYMRPPQVRATAAATRRACRLLFSLLALLFSGGLISACMDEEKPRPTPPAAVVTAADAADATTPAAQATGGPADGTTPAALPASRPAAEPAPLISLSVNGGAGEVFAGWPIVLSARVMHPRATAWDAEAEISPMVIGSGSGPWSDAITLRVKDAHGQDQTWPLQLATTPSATISLDVRTAGALAWLLPPEATANIAEGTYQLSALLEAGESTTPGAWKGSARSVPVLLRVSREPASLSPDQLSAKHQLRAYYALLRDDQAGATAQIDELLAKQPDDPGGLEFKGDILAMQGRQQEALSFYDRALEAFYAQNPDLDEPPTALLHKRRELWSKLATEQQP